MIRNYLYGNLNGRCKIGVEGAHGEPCACRFIGGRCDYLEKTINLRDIHKYNEPLIIYNTYRNEATEAIVVFPPFSDYTVENESYAPYVASYTFTCSGFVDLFEYILDNYCDVMGFGFYNIHHILCIIRDEGWKYAVTLHGDQFTNVETGEVVFGFRNVIDKIVSAYFWDHIEYEQGECYDD